MVKVLCTADLHLGRAPSRLPRHVTAPGGRPLSAGFGWLQLVELAVAEAVDIVLLAGDVVDRANRFFEAFGPLEQGLATLAAAGIPVVAVAGNHDFDVLPRLAANFSREQFHLLGAGGRWERFSLRRNGNVKLQIDGWSFPRQHVAHNPLAAYDLPPPDPAVPHMGLLHADLDQGDSQYAPVKGPDLLQTPPSFWLLGHIHKPRLIKEHGRPRLLYPGSPLALSPAETGPHGPWLLAFAGPGNCTVQQVPQTPVRYENITVDLTAVQELGDVDGAIFTELQETLAVVAREQGDTCRCLVGRLTFTGRTPLHKELPTYLGNYLPDLELKHEGVTAVVDHYFLATRPRRDLEQLAASSGPPGVLARRLLALQTEGDPRRAELLAVARRQVNTTFHPFRRSLTPAAGEDGVSLLAGPPEVAEADGRLAAILLEQGYLLLDELLGQKEADLP